MDSQIDRDNYVYIAKLAEQAERYEEVMDAMKKVATLGVELTGEERNLLLIGYRNVIGKQRASWRILSSLEQKEEAKAKGDEEHVKMIRQYRKKVESEISEICSDIVAVVGEHLLPSATNAENSVFFYKIKGDYWRYLAEFKIGEDRKEAVDQSLQAYQTALSTAETDLPPAHPVRLGLLLNFAVFHYEIMNSPERACSLAKQTLNEAVPEIEFLEEGAYKESNLIMQLLRENLTMWTFEEEAKASAGEEREGGGIIPR